MERNSLFVHANGDWIQGLVGRSEHVNKNRFFQGIANSVEFIRFKKIKCPSFRDAMISVRPYYPFNRPFDDETELFLNMLVGVHSGPFIKTRNESPNVISPHDQNIRVDRGFSPFHCFCVNEFSQFQASLLAFVWQVVESVKT